MLNAATTLNKFFAAVPFPYVCVCA